MRITRLKPITEKELQKANAQYNSRPFGYLPYEVFPMLYNGGCEFYKITAKHLEDDKYNRVMYLISNKPFYMVQQSAYTQFRNVIKKENRDDFIYISREVYPYEVDMDKTVLDNDINLSEF